MRFIYTFLYFYIPKGYSDYQIRKSIIFRTKYLREDYAFFLRLKHVLIIQFKALMTILLIPFKLYKLNAGIVLFNAGTKPLVIDQRGYFIKKYTGEEKITSAMSGFDGRFFYDGFSAKMIFFILKLYTVFSLALFSQILFKPKIDINWSFGLYKNLIQLCLLQDNRVSCYFFLLSSPETYLCALFGSIYFKKLSVNVISSNSLMYSDNRYLYMPDAKLKYCSKIQKEELRLYIIKRWVEVKEATLWGLEEASEYDRIKYKTARFDIGIYSSGGWARDQNMLRIKDFERLQKHPNLDNYLYKIFEEIMKVVIGLKNSHDLQVVLYPHPCERLAMKNGVCLPYQHLLDKYDIYLDGEGDNSIEKIFEAKVGIASVSTIIFDRLHFDLPGYVFSGTGIKDFLIDPRYLGKYADYCFDGPEDLTEKIIKEIA